MKKLIGLSVGLVLLAGGVASCKKTVAPQVINGIVYDASMNNILVITDQGDTVDISTMNADPQKVPGVLISDSVKVTCADEEVNGTKVLKATELTITAHSPYYYIQGTWVEPIPGVPTQMQGFKLNEDGSASSVNMATLLFKSWKLTGKVLTLNSESIGNGQTIVGEDTLDIVRIDADSLVLARKGYITWRLAREKQ